MSKKYLINQMSWTEFQEAIKHDDLVVIPIGVSEQHGRHNPVGTDTYIAEECANRLGKKGGFLIAPTLRYGSSAAVRNYPGTIHINPLLLKKLVISYAESFIQHGAKRILFLNGHGGNDSVLGAACAHLYEAHGTICSHSEWWNQMPFFPKKWNCSEHGGVGETSMCMASRPGMVRMEYATDQGPDPFIPGMEGGRFKEARVGLSVDMFKINKHGNRGNAEKASPELGNEMMDEYVDFVIEFCNELKKVKDL